MDDLKSPTEICKAEKIKYHQFLYCIKTRGIEPDRVFGNIRAYGTGKQKLIAAALRDIGVNRRNHVK